MSDVVKSPAGWFWPLNSKKAHYFEEGSATSACRRWLVFSNQREPGNNDSVDNCVTCKRRATKSSAQ